MSSKGSINLLSKSDFEKTSLGKISVWALSAGRWIVILTELVVISAFLYRFSLDQRISNLKEEIEEKRNAVAAFSAQEERFRETQRRLSVLGKAFDEYRDFEPIFDQLKLSLPEGLALTDINVRLSNENSTKTNGYQILMDGTSVREESISNLVSNMNRSELFGIVTLEKISLERQSSTSEDVLFEFTILAEIAE